MGKLKELREQHRAANKEYERLNMLLKEFKYGNGEEFEDRFDIEEAMGAELQKIGGLEADIAELKAKRSAKKGTKGGSRRKRSRKSKKTRRSRQ